MVWDYIHLSIPMDKYFFLHIIMDVFTYPWLDSRYYMLVIGPQMP